MSRFAMKRHSTLGAGKWIRHAILTNIQNTLAYIQPLIFHLVIDKNVIEYI